MAKKSTKKEVVIEQQETTALNGNEEVKMVETTDMNLTVEEIEKSVDNIEKTIDETIEEKISENLTDINIQTELDPISDIMTKVKEISVSNEELIEKISSSTPEEAEKFIEDEIKKVEDIKKSIDKINKKSNPEKSTIMTNWWNGMGYDF